MQRILSIAICISLFGACHKKNNSPAPQPSAPESPTVNPENPPLLPPDPGTSSQVLIGLRIQAEGNFLVGQKKQLKAVAQYDSPAEEKEVIAEWSFLSNEAEALLENDGGMLARKPGPVLVGARFGDKTANLVLNFEYPLVQWKEDQFWVYRLEAQKLLFNTSWDAESGNDIRRDSEAMPDYALACLDDAKARFTAWQTSAAGRELLGPLLVAGAPLDMIFLVNVVALEGRRDALRRLDRDAYFWLWPYENQRPSLAMTDFHQGVWVWEIIASPQSCLQPDEKETIRLVQYARHRLGLPKQEGKS